MGYVTGLHDVDRMSSRTKAVSAASSSSSSSSSSGSSSQRLLPKRWRSKAKSSASSSSGSSQQAMWCPEGPCTWCCVSGRRVVLKPISILQLSEAERLALQKLACSRLQAMDMGCPVVVPKDNIGEWGRQRKRALSLKRKCKSANLGSLLDTLASDKGKDKDKGQAFGIALSRVILNDRQRTNARRESTAVSAVPSTTPSSSSTPPVTTPLQGHRRTGSADLLLTPTLDRKSSSSSQGSLENGAANGNPGSSGNLSESSRRVASSDSLSTWDESNESAAGYNLIEALSLSAPGGDAGQSQLLGDGPQVPHIVSTCFHHLETYGLNVVGIFRVGSSKKRVKQLREEFDSRHQVTLTEDHNPHDVGALLKEFFRDLPEPLLTRDLFLPFVATRKIKDRTKQVEAMRLLLTLLPVANRDTLWSLLCFLFTVHRHSEDSVDSTGQEVAGNKMDSQNLATVFGPNVLHCLRPALSEKQMLAECAEQAEQSAEVIAVTKDLIDLHTELFEVSGSQHDEVLKLMMETDRENLEIALRRLSSEQGDLADLDNNSISTGTSDTVSLSDPLRRAAGSDADLLSLVQRRRQESGIGQHQPLRACRSADPWTEEDKEEKKPSSPSLLRGPADDDDNGLPGVRGGGGGSSDKEEKAEREREGEEQHKISEESSIQRRRRPMSSTAAVSGGEREDADERSSRVVGVYRRRSRGESSAGSSSGGSGSSARPLCRQGAVRERPHSDSLQGLGGGGGGNRGDYLVPPPPPSSSSSDGGSSGTGQGEGGRRRRRGEDVSPGGVVVGGEERERESGGGSGLSQEQVGSGLPNTAALSPRLPALRPYPGASSSASSRPRVEREVIRIRKEEKEEKESTSSSSTSSVSIAAATTSCVSAAILARRAERREQRERERRRAEEEEAARKKEKEAGKDGERQWQRERWRHWQQLSADKLLDSEQETLV